MVLLILLAAVTTGCLEAGDTLDGHQTLFGNEASHENVKFSDSEKPSVSKRHMSNNEKLLAGTVVVHSLDSDGSGSQGSGFAIAHNRIITNHHVIENGGEITVIDANGNRHNGHVSKSNSGFDLAMIEGDFSEILTLKLTNDRPAVGDEIWVAGAPEGFQGTLSTGIVSAMRDESYLGFESFQITAPISPGSSGGPVMDATGSVIGVSVATFKSGQSLNFAVPAFYIQKLLKRDE